jgi:hypothetical protein
MRGEVHLFGVDVRVDVGLVVAVMFAVRGAAAAALRPIAAAAPFAPAPATCGAASAGIWGRGRLLAGHKEVLGGEFRSSGIGRWAVASLRAPAAAVALALPGALAGSRTRRFVRDAGIGRGGGSRFIATALGAYHADVRVAATAAKEAALAFIQDGYLDFIGASAQARESLLKSVFYGFAACFGLIHWSSSILERV